MMFLIHEDFWALALFYILMLILNTETRDDDEEGEESCGDNQREGKTS